MLVSKHWADPCIRVASCQCSASAGRLIGHMSQSLDRAESARTSRPAYFCTSLLAQSSITLSVSSFQICGLNTISCRVPVEPFPLAAPPTLTLLRPWFFDALRPFLPAPYLLTCCCGLWLIVVSTAFIHLIDDSE